MCMCPSAPVATTWYVSATGEGLQDTIASPQEGMTVTFFGGHGSVKR